ncbi:MAG: hypothetical protein QM662_00385, partial [Gordonia sp. (in: high G+C Gram-positive bacteria)]
MSPVFGKRRSPLTRMVGAMGVAMATAIATATATDAAAAPPPLPTEFASSRYAPVNPDRYRSLAYSDNGRTFFTTGRWLCQIGPVPGDVGCRGRPATAPRDAVGAVITADQQGPFWDRPGLLGPSTYRFGSRAGFRAPLLRTGQSLAVADV